MCARTFETTKISPLHGLWKMLYVDGSPLFLDRQLRWPSQQKVFLLVRNLRIHNGLHPCSQVHSIHHRNLVINNNFGEQNATIWCYTFPSDNVDIIDDVLNELITSSLARQYSNRGQIHIQIRWNKNESVQFGNIQEHTFYFWKFRIWT